MALWPSEECGEHHCYSGSAAVNGAGEVMLFYTSISGPSGKGPQEQIPRVHYAAIGDANLIHWTKVSYNPVACHTDGNGQIVSAQDPYVFRHAGRTYLIVTSFTGVNSQPGTHIYKATDETLTAWRYRGIMAPDARPCVNFFKVGEKWVLIGSNGAMPDRYCYYRSGNFDPATCTFTAEHSGRLDYGGNQYATIAMIDGNGRVYLLGWTFNRKGYDTPGRGWVGFMGLPRQAKMDANGRLRQTSVETLTALRRDPIGLPEGMELHNEIRVLPELQGDTFEIDIELEWMSPGLIGLQIRRSVDGSRAVEIKSDGANLFVLGTGEENVSAPVIVPLALPHESALRLQIFLDKCSLEIFVNSGDEYIAEFLHCDPSDSGVALFALEGQARVQKFRAWRLAAIW